MLWTSAGTDERRRAAAIRAALTRAAFDGVGGGPALERLGVVLGENGNSDLAGAALQLARRAHPAAFREWHRLGHALLRSARAGELLDLCGEAPDSSTIRALRGQALELLGRHEEALVVLESAIDDRMSPSALDTLLKLAAHRGDPDALLGLCAALPPRWRNSPLDLAYRSIGLCQAGKADAARAFVDPDRHVARVAFSPPASFGGIASFNDQLAAEILAAIPATWGDRERVILHAPVEAEGSALQALRHFIGQEMERFIGEMAERGLDAVMPPPPASAALHVAQVVLRGGGHNGEHVHALGYVSAVYHVRVPRMATGAKDDRGALLIGACKGIAGVEPCWGVRALHPVEGVLVIMPSHIFHDVAPTHSAEERISVAADLWPDPDSEWAGAS